MVIVGLLLRSEVIQLGILVHKSGLKCPERWIEIIEDNWSENKHEVKKQRKAKWLFWNCWRPLNRYQRSIRRKKMSTKQQRGENMELTRTRTNNENDQFQPRIREKRKKGTVDGINFGFSNLEYISSGWEEVTCATDSPFAPLQRQNEKRIRSNKELCLVCHIWKTQKKIDEERCNDTLR